MNSILGAEMVIALIFADYIRKYNTDTLQRTIFLTLLGCTAISIICDAVFYYLNGKPGDWVAAMLHLDLTFYYIFQVAAFYFAFIFFDYISFKDLHRTKITLAISCFFISATLILQLINFKFPIYYYITENNVFVHGRFFIIRLLIAYLPAVIILWDFFTAVKKLHKGHVFLLITFLVLIMTGSVVDILLKTTNFIWPCFTTALLYSYFFIVRTDSKLDSLTGIGNRYSFNEFISNLSHQTGKESYSIVMIDVDHFKQINDTLGHLEGDNALRDLAAIIKGCIRHNDFAARYGGDEFILAAKAEYNIEKILERIQESITNQNDKNVRPYKIEISFGLDIFTTNSGQSIEEFLAHIDSLMYKNKAERRRKNDEAKAGTSLPA
jgi:diguanylate cyclase (GGDEF)-like protein